MFSSSGILVIKISLWILSKGWLLIGFSVCLFVFVLVISSQKEILFKKKKKGRKVKVIKKELKKRMSSPKLSFASVCLLASESPKQWKVNKPLVYSFFVLWTGTSLPRRFSTQMRFGEVFFLCLDDLNW